MIANLFSHQDAFLYNNRDTKDQVAEKLRALVCDMSCIIYKYKDENHFMVSSKLFSIQVFANTTIIDLAEQCLDPDKKGVFYSMIGDTSYNFEGLSLEDLRAKCRYDKKEKEVNSIVVLNVPEYALSAEDKAETEDEAKKVHKSIVRDYITFNEYSIIYSKNTWTYLRRQILGNHPGCHKDFIEECKEYFPQLLFHKNCISSLSDDNYDYLKTSSRKIVYYLSCLNDNFKNFFDSHKMKGCDANTILADFSGQYGLDGAGSLQQNPNQKEAFTYQFKCNNGSFCNILCEPHLKIEQKDERYKQSVDYRTFHPRVYFGFPDINFEKGKIPIGSIGRHL